MDGTDSYYYNDNNIIIMNINFAIIQNVANNYFCFVMLTANIGTYVSNQLSPLLIIIIIHKYIILAKMSGFSDNTT